jgi:hypothetical protein
VLTDAGCTAIGQQRPVMQDDVQRMGAIDDLQLLQSIPVRPGTKLAALVMALRRPQGAPRQHLSRFACFQRRNRAKPAPVWWRWRESPLQGAASPACDARSGGAKQCFAKPRLRPAPADCGHVYEPRNCIKKCKSHPILLGGFRIFWWRWRESNPRPQALYGKLYILSLVIYI